MENIEKETASSKFMENPYIEMKKKISVNGIVTLYGAQNETYIED